VLEFAASTPTFCADNKVIVLFTHSQRDEIMANIAKLTFGAAIAAVSIAFPASAQYASQSGLPISLSTSNISG
jgi:hypothetical protein